MMAGDIYDIPYGEELPCSPAGVFQIVTDDAEGVDWGQYPPESSQGRYEALAPARGMCTAVVVGVVFWMVFIVGLVTLYRWIFA
jgi:hypothetical protein